MISNRTFLIAGLVIALLIGVVAVFFASGDPDGLESTALVVQGHKDLTGGTPADAEIHEEAAGRFSYESPMPDYSLGEQLGQPGAIVAIFLGTILAFLVVLGIAYGIRAARKTVKPDHQD
jgi:cobalt/nickel transport protein